MLRQHKVNLLTLLQRSNLILFRSWTPPSSDHLESAYFNRQHFKWLVINKLIPLLVPPILVTGRKLFGPSSVDEFLWTGTKLVVSFRLNNWVLRFVKSGHNPKQLPPCASVWKRITLSESPMTSVQLWGWLITLSFTFYWQISGFIRIITLTWSSATPQLMIIPRDRETYLLYVLLYRTLAIFCSHNLIMLLNTRTQRPQTLTNSISLLCQQTWTFVNSRRDSLLKLQWRRWLRPRREASIPGGSLRQIAAGNLQISRWDRSLSNLINKWGIFNKDPHHESDDVDQHW